MLHVNKLHVNEVRTTTRKMTLRQSGTLFWNSLDDTITHSKTLKLFQNKTLAKRFSS